MATYFLLSGIDKTLGIQGKVVDYLKASLKGKRKLAVIASSPDNYEETDKYFYGNGIDILGTVNMFKKLSDTINEIVLVDYRLSKDEVLNKLMMADVIYLMPGNPVTQIKYIKKTGLVDYIKNFKGVIIGVSAGSMNMSKTVYYSKDEDYPETFTYEGLGLVDITIDPHFDIEDTLQVSEAIKESYKHSIIGLPDHSSIIVSEDTTFIGEYYIIENGIVNKK